MTREEHNRQLESDIDLWAQALEDILVDMASATNAEGLLFAVRTQPIVDAFIVECDKIRRSMRAPKGQATLTPFSGSDE
jgi:hypothetical protein